MNIFVFDDNKVVCELLVKVISSYVHKNFQSADIKVVGSTSVEKTEIWIEKNKPDIAVLDIIVNGNENFGIDLAGKIRKKYRDSHIVFFTSDENKITKVFTGLIRPTQFIVKGKDFSELETVICEIVKDTCNVCDEICETVKVSYGRNEYMLNSSDIVLVQKSGRKTEILLEDRRIEVADTVSGIAKMLPSHFRFVDKGVVVNLRMVSEAKYSERNLILADGQVVYMSRNSVNEVKAALSGLVRRGENVGVAVS